MTKSPVAYTQFSGGIADFLRLGIDNSFAFARSVDIRTDPQNITALPRTIKESGTVIVDLPKWGETYINNLTSYIYGNTGMIYSRTSAGSYTNLRQVANSHGNGLVYSAEDDYLYYSRDKVIGRYGPLFSASPTFTDDFLGAQGGVPLNTNSLDLEASSSQYASHIDSPSLSITGSISFDAQIKPESLPLVGNQMVLMSKWDESAALRSYKFDINTASGYFGDGSDGTLTISSNTQEAPIDSACTGAVGTTALTATNASFVAGQIVLIHQSKGTGAGTWMRNSIQSYTLSNMVLDTPLNANYTVGAQVRVLSQYTNVTVNSGVTYSPKPWNGTVGGILAFLASGTFSGPGTVDASGSGFIGAPQNTTQNTSGSSGEGASAGSGGSYPGSGNPGAGGGGSYGSLGTSGESASGAGGSAGALGGTADLTTMLFGGAGGSGGAGNNSEGGGGGNGGGIIFISAATIANGAITSAGSNGSNATVGAASSGGGAGAGGSILLKTQIGTLGTSITALGGTGGSKNGGGSPLGGNGGNGRVHLDYYTSYMGTSNPTLDATQDNTLVTNTSYQLRLSISSNGASSETLAQSVNLQIGQWQQVGVSWNQPTKVATFYLNAVAIGTRTGTLAAINDNAGTFQVGMSKDATGTPVNFYDGLIDEARLFSVARSASDMVYGLNQQIPVNTMGLQAYYKFNGDYTDATANANNLTPTNAPVFSSDVPYPSPTTRLDIDQVDAQSGDTYAVPIAISEASNDRKTFTPARDPQKSIQFNIATVGSGNWTITIHDSFNNVIATSNVSNANLHTGPYEFVYSNVWSPLTNFTNEYHAHITSTVADGIVVTDANNDLETADFVTYYQFLITDTEWHPMARFLNFWVIGNGHYVGKYEATLYDPNLLVLQAGLRVRCFAYWNEYLAIGVQKGNNIYDFDQGRIYFWDGIAPTFNFYIDVPEGGINAMLGSRGKLYVWAGYKNQLLEYTGGDSAQKVKDLPKMDTNYSEIYPQAVTMWQSLLRYGVAGNGDSTAIQKGVYTYGSTNLRFPDMLTYDYPISTGTYSGVNTKVGLTMVVNKELLIGWQDGASFGMDYVDDSNMPFPTSFIEFLVTDADAIWKEKEAVEIDVNFVPLLSGQSVSSRYSIDDTDTWITNADTPVDGDSISRQLLTDGRYHEMQVGVDIVSTNTSPTVKGLLLVPNTNASEGRTG